MSDIDANYLGLTANRLAKIATELKSENTKLREFARMMLLVCKRYGIVGGVFVRLSNNRNGNCNLEERVNFESLARELGIEAE